MVWPLKWNLFDGTFARYHLFFNILQNEIWPFPWVLIFGVTRLNSTIPWAQKTLYLYVNVFSTKVLSIQDTAGTAIYTWSFKPCEEVTVCGFIKKVAPSSLSPGGGGGGGGDFHIKMTGALVSSEIFEKYPKGTRGQICRFQHLSGINLQILCPKGLDQHARHFRIELILRRQI